MTGRRGHLALALVLLLPSAAQALPRSFCFSEAGTAETTVYLSLQPHAGARWVFFSATPAANALKVHLSAEATNADVAIVDPCEDASRRVHVTLQPSAGVPAVYVTPTPTIGATWYFMTPVAEGADVVLYVANPFLQRADVVAAVLLVLYP